LSVFRRGSGGRRSLHATLQTWLRHLEEEEHSWWGVATLLFSCSNILMEHAQHAGSCQLHRQHLATCTLHCMPILFLITTPVRTSHAC
jgi:hypothetical protein